ncbi:MAG: flavodoxin-dependent (E)-4-hydroxy-3-methylbut-2-enyl-diphosphate synthase [Treponema sp.]|jgi:(E)-4-hydroxy-3-methylbut-2-enyl-diphosphate synthase|nr:flavodoxin-dependent (E)-4-hydroxy-3-methylbut-2-enyl-diphosphate synthase [Treponema sp.]
MTVVIGGNNGIRRLCLGGNNPVAVQTMWKTRLPPEDLEGEAGEAVIGRIEALSVLGCDLLRFAVPDIQAAETLGRLASRVSMPLCADIHFDYRVALRCLDFPIAKLRINPGNIGSKSRTEAVLSAAASKKIPIRIGVNAGSLPPALRKKLEAGTIGRAEALVEAALEEIALFDKFGFTDFVVSMKASGIADTIKANRLFRRQSAAPLHIGVTEAGPLVAGTVRNTAALLPLLTEGIGDTLRVSLSDTMENEVIAAREILTAAAEAGCDRARGGAVIISCPLCGRNGFDTHAFTERWMRRLYALEKPLSIAVMGCAVNGPGEAKHADLGITGAGNKVLIFRHGKALRTVNADDADKAFEEELLKL